jgi:hypothetical protein
MKIAEFTEFTIGLLKAIIKKGDDHATADQATIQKLSADLSIANNTIKDLQAALAEGDAERVKELVDLAAKQAAELDAVSSELSSRFNPTPIADAVVSTVASSEVIPTPPEVEAATTIGTMVGTSAAVSDAALDAIAAVQDLGE